MSSNLAYRSLEIELFSLGSASISSNSRADWIDAAKGIAIFLVVVGHAWRGMHGSGLIENARMFEFLDRTIYLFHMPILFIISGIFFPKILDRSMIDLSIDRSKRLLYPLILWTYLFAIGKLLFGANANSPMEVSEFPWLPLPPIWQFWFLWALFTMSIIAALIHKTLICRIRFSGAGWAIVLAIVLLTNFDRPDLGRLWPYFGATISYAPFFVLGIIIGSSERLPLLSPFLALAVFLLAQMLALYWRLPPVAMIFAAALASIAVLTLCHFASVSGKASYPMQGLCVMGTASMAIYLAHTFFSAPVRALLIAMDVEGILTHLILGTAAGIAGPLVLLAMSNRTGVRRLLGF